MHNRFSSPSLTNCRFSGNQAGGIGGGMENYNSSPELTNCSVLGNQASGGGGVSNSQASSPRFNNCSFSGNRAANLGGAVWNISQSNPTFTNCLIYDNQSGNSTNSTSASVADIAYSNSTYSYSLIHNITTGTSNNNLDGSLNPLFVDPLNPAAAPTTAGDLRLQAGSPAIDAGDNIANMTAVDQAGNPRITDGDGNGSDLIDLGAYEAPDIPFCTPNAIPDPTNDPLTWTGAVNSAWNEGCNWSSELVPDADNPVTIPTGTSNAPALQPNTTYAA